MLRKIAIAGLCAASATAFKLEEQQLLKRDGAHSHDHEPSSGYGAPSPSYSEPAASYGAPETGYGAPSDSYGVSYGGYEEESLPDLTPIIVGILVLTGLSLLFPTFVSLTSVRRKRDADGKEAFQACYKMSSSPTLPSQVHYDIGSVRLLGILSVRFLRGAFTHMVCLDDWVWTLSIPK